MGARLAVPVTLLTLLVVAVGAWPASGRAAGSGGVAPGPAPAPYRGVDTWYAYGPQIDEARVTALARALLATRLPAAGYRIVWLDAGWWSGTRSTAGAITVKSRQWPHGMAWLAAYLHARGLLAGIYTDLGAHGCGNGGSLRHYRGDVDQFAAWGFDAVKADFCGGTAEHLSPRRLYAAFAAALADARPRRHMLLAVADAAMPGPHGYPAAAESVLSVSSWAPALATSWRTGPDLGAPGRVRYAAVMRNAELDLSQPGARGAVGDPDYLTPTAGLSAAEAQAQLTMWATLRAPLMLSADPADLSAAELGQLENPRLLSLDADPTAPPRRLGGAAGVELWRRELSGAGHALSLLATGEHPARVVVSATELGLPPGAPLHVLDVWREHELEGSGSITVTVPGDGAVLLETAPAG